MVALKVKKKKKSNYNQYNFEIKKQQMFLKNA